MSTVQQLKTKHHKLLSLLKNEEAFCDRLLVQFVLVVKKGGDVMADFDELYSKYGEMLYKIAFLYFGNGDDAEDALQEVFVKALTKLPNADDERQKAWLIRVTQNQCRDMLKKSERKNLLIDENVLAKSSDDYSNESRIDVLQKIVGLNQKYKAVIILYYYYDYSVSQIADTLKTSQSSVKMRLKRGRELLKIELEGYENEA